MKRAIVVLGLVGCTTASPPPEDMPPLLPDGIWAPMPGASILDASLAADGDTVWWTATRRIKPAETTLFDDGIWLSATSSTGELVVEPAPVAPGSSSKFDPDVVITPSAVIAKVGGYGTMLRRYDRDGVALGEPYAVSIDEVVSQTELVATSDGGVQLVASLPTGDSEVAIHAFDPTGTPTTTTFAGTPDTVEGGTSAASIAAAARADGSVLVAWDRHYNGCISSLPSAAFTATVDRAVVGPIQPVRDMPASELRPAIAASGETAYVAWESDGSRISLARYPDVGTVVAELGDPARRNTQVLLALAAPGKGVIGWHDSVTETLQVVPFEDRAGTMFLGEPQVVRSVDPNAYYEAAGLVHVGGDRYVIGWIETKRNLLYAKELELAGSALRPAPPVSMTPVTPSEPRRWRCP